PWKRSGSSRPSRPPWSSKCPRSAWSASTSRRMLFCCSRSSRREGTGSPTAHHPWRHRLAARHQAAAEAGAQGG
ncbi:unnamed protein product, partial [Effrenium voratum]